MFNHVFSAYPGQPVYWRFSGGSARDYHLYLGNGTTDTITFDVSRCGEVVYGAVTTSLYGVNESTSIRFVGSEGNWQTGPEDYGTDFVEITAAQIGAISRIELQSWQGVFYGITIGVVPEPELLLLLFVLIGTGMLAYASHRPERS